MSSEELTRKRDDVQALLAAFQFVQHRVNDAHHRVEAIGMPAPLARMLGLLPSGEQMLEEITVERGRLILEECARQERGIVDELQVATDALGLEATLPPEVSAAGGSVQYMTGIIADRVIALMRTDSDIVDELVRQVGGA